MTTQQEWIKKHFKKYSTRENDLKEIEGIIEKYNNEFESQGNDQSEENDNSQKELELQEELNNKKEEIDNLKSKVGELKEKEEELEFKIFSLNRQIKNANDQEKKNLEEELEEAKKELERTQRELKANEEARGKLRSEVNNLRDQLSDLRIAKSSESDEINNNQNRAINEENKELKEKLSSLETKIKELLKIDLNLPLPTNWNELLVKKDEINEIGSELSELKAKLEAVKKEKDELEKKLADKEKEKDEGKIDSEETEKLRKQLEEAKKEIEELRRKVDKSKEQLNSELQTSQRLIEDLKAELVKKKEDCKKTSTPEELEKGLDSLCAIQKQIDELEVKREEIERIIQSLKVVTIAPVIPPQLLNKESDLEDLVNESESFSFNKILSDNQEFTLYNNSSLQKLPTRLYDVLKNQIVEAKDLNIKNYAILSYVWGNSGELTEEAKQKLDNSWKSIGYQNPVNPSGYKSLQKAIETCKLLNVDYLWMDQLCTNQNSTDDKNKEVPKMRQYYFNSAVTLIAINRNLSDEEATTQGINSEKVLEKVVRSQWFSRSWTFQEGWLSKQTIFMFDNHLIDGSLLANRWVLGQPAYTDDARYQNILDEGTQKIATPLGWVHYKEGYDEEDRISFSLNQALRAIKNRGRGVSVDGIYSILGLLPYGEQVPVNYKTWGERYSKQDLHEALFDAMSTALIEGGYNEYFAWHGSGNKWLPEIYEEDDSGYPRKTKGGTSIEGGINISSHPLIKFESEFKFNASKLTIEKIHNRLNHKEEKDKGSVIDSGACLGKISIENIKDEISLLTSEKVLKSIKKGDEFLLLSKEEWKSSKHFALIARKKDDGDYQRIGLVEIGKIDWEKLWKGAREEKLKFLIDEKQTQVQLARIEINPNKNN